MRHFKNKMIFWIGMFQCLFSGSVAAQGMINDYHEVTALSGTVATVNSINGINGIHTLAIGDTVLIIQMQGAAINQTNSAAFGTPTVNNAGNYEINVICGISGNQVAFKFNLVNSYTPVAGAVQIVTHGNGKLTSYTVPPAGIVSRLWNGTVGGVVFVKADAITLNGNVSASGLGFRGGDVGGIIGNPGTVCWQNIGSWNNDGCNGATVNAGVTDYFYPKNILATMPATRPANLLDQYKGAWKGEGIAKYITDMETGRGAQANGGGGGQTHNSGGAGGSLFGKGGTGGRQWDIATPATLVNGGLGGFTLTPSQTKLFMGGGGGGGHGNYPNGNSSKGADGGGIVLFKGASLTMTTNRTISADGDNNLGIKDGDSEGGGGAGGSIYLDVPTVNTGANTLTFSVKGGRGGDAINNGDCIGTGGGGGGGYILSRANIPTAATALTGGVAGVVTGITNTSKPCYGAGLDKWGATDGTDGDYVDGQTSYRIPLGTVVVPCVLSLEFISFKGILKADKVQLVWVTAKEVNTDHFQVERSRDGLSYESIGTVSSQSISQGMYTYTFWDGQPLEGLCYYRLKQVDKDGTLTYSNMISVSYESTQIQVFPNPNAGAFIIYLTEKTEPYYIEIADIEGRVVYQTNDDEVLENIEITNLKSGIYMLRYKTEQQLITKKIVVK